jgi:hypothetical protein
MKKMFVTIIVKAQKVMTNDEAVTGSKKCCAIFYESTRNNITGHFVQMVKKYKKNQPP